ncbi:MAG: hypothetical protein ACFE9Z_01760 [Promethearchaeota archaeon]
MVDNHSYSFFGQKVGLIVQSASKNEPYIFFQLIKSKNDGSWEKPSSGEGKAIRFSLEEVTWILGVLSKELSSWSISHNYKENKTSISFKWEDGEIDKLWIHIGNYSKVLDYGQYSIMHKLLNHLLYEKIEFATGINMTKNSKKENTNMINNLFIQEEVISEQNNGDSIETDNEYNHNSSKVINVNGIIRSETDKALLIQIDNDSEVWIPKSKIHSSFNATKNLVQTFTIDRWILRNNNLVS